MSFFLLIITIMKHVERLHITAINNKVAEKLVQLLLLQAGRVAGSR